MGILLLGGSLSDQNRAVCLFVSLHSRDHGSLKIVWVSGERDEAGMTTRAQEDRFQAILGEYERPLRRLVSAYERDADLQNDLFQEITLALWRALPTFRGDSSERTFVYRIAHNRALTHSAKRHPAQLELDVALQIPALAPDPEQVTVLHWQKAELQARILALPLTLRQAVTLALEGLSNADIGEVLGITEGNVAVRLTRAKKQLKLGDAR